MTLIVTMSTIERDAQLANFIRHALIELTGAIKRQTDLLAAQGIDRAMDALERAQELLGREG